MEPTMAAESISVMNPATGELIQEVTVDTPERVESIVNRVRANQPAWEALGFKGRRDWLNELRDWILDNSERILDTMQAETGKVRAGQQCRNLPQSKIKLSIVANTA